MDNKSCENEDENGKARCQDSQLKPTTEQQTYFSDEKILIPEVPGDGFSFKKLWAFTGPGFLMSIAYLDPGNIQSDLKSGITANYKLLWVLMSATILGLIMQRLSTRLGVVTGVHLAEMCYIQYKKLPRFILWIMIEIAIIGSDMQEVIGTAIALYLLSFGYIPLTIGVFITVLDTFTFLLLDKYGLRKLEIIFGFLITLMGISFGYQYFRDIPPQSDVFSGMFMPWKSEYDSSSVGRAVEIVGAVIMPHNLYLHSALVKSRAVDRSKSNNIKEANKYFFTESSIALFVSFIINVFVVSVFANGLFGKNEDYAFETCSLSGNENFNNIFKNTSESMADIGNIYNGGIYLGCKFGVIAMYIWGVGILAAGQSSTMTGTYAGQFAMEGFLNLKWPRWKRILLTRCIAIIPAVFIAFSLSIGDFSNVSDLLNGVMSLQLPFATIPVIAFTSSHHIMGNFKNGLLNKIVTTALSGVVITINIYFVIATAQKYVNGLISYFIFGLFAIFYIAFCIYLVIHMAISMGATYLLKYEIIEKYIGSPVELSSLENQGSVALNLK